MDKNDDTYDDDNEDDDEEDEEEEEDEYACASQWKNKACLLKRTT